MTTVTGLTAARMLAIEAMSVVSGNITGDNLILTKHDGSTINAGNVRGPQGIQGIPGPTGSNLITNAMLNNAANQPGAESATSTFSPNIVASGTAFAFGTSPTRQGQFIVIGKLCFVEANINVGTTPTVGTGNYAFSLPLAPANPAVPTLFIPGGLRASTLTGGLTIYVNSCIVIGTAVQFRYNATYMAGTDTVVGASTPAAPQTNTRYEYYAIYEID